LRKKEASFSEEKEAKRLLSVWAGLGVLAWDEKFFGSFFSKKNRFLTV
jgi:hypothetical protein